MLKEASQNLEYYNKSIEELILFFNSDVERGLNSSELQKGYFKFGYNELPKIKKSIWRVYLAPIFNFLIVILIITGIIVIILGSPESTIITFTVVIINSGTAIIQQYRAQKALESLRRISALQATVLRDNTQSDIPTRTLIPGDIVLLNQGNKVPADGRIIESMNLSIDQAPLTGESEPITKNNIIIERNDLSIQEQANMVFMGTYINTGRGKMLVTNTGINTEIGKISNQLNEMGSIEDIPLTQKLNRLGYILGIIVIINLIILISYKFTILILQDRFVEKEISQALLTSIFRAMNVVPINLPLLSTLVLITGVLKMAQSGVIIKNLSAIESLGRVSIICSDKTGTITKNEMSVEKFWINNKEYTVTGSGYDIEGEILLDGEKLNLNSDLTFLSFIQSIVINNNAKLISENIKVHVGDIKEKTIRRALGSPTEAALLVLTEKAGFSPDDLKKKYKILAEFSFSSEVKKMTTICSPLDNEHEIFGFSKGAPEKIMEISSQIEIDGEIKPFSKKLKLNINNKIHARAIQGFRTLGIAYQKMGEFDEKPRESVEKDLIFLGFVSIMDPPRIGVKDSVDICKSAGIKVVMITGDHPATAKTIASEMGIFKDRDLVVEGAEIKELRHNFFKEVSVFARVEPLDKEIIVRNYQKEDKVVAMTGDGINDALALKLANAGIAMGITGTDVAKETADMIISDDNFTSIEKGVRIGRGLFSKIRTIIYFFICLNIMEAAIFFGYEFYPDFDIFKSNWQHIYIFGIVHSLPSLALVVDTHPKDIMNEPPRNEEEILNKYMWLMLLIQAFLMGIGLVLAIELTRNGIIPLNGWNTNEFFQLSYIPNNTSNKELANMKARTMFMTTLYIVETFFIWTIRRPNKSLIKSIKEELSIILVIISLVTISLHILVIMFSYELNKSINETLGLNFQLNFMFLSATDWLICILLALPGLFGIEILKFYARNNNIIL